MFLRVAHELGRGIEAHRLGVEQGGGEDLGVVVLHPRGVVDQDGEARGMALREAVFTEAFDLLEAAFGKFALIAVVDHASDEVALELVDRAGPAERRHGATQLVGFGGREACADDGDLHGLLLEQGHAVRSFQDAPELSGIFDVLVVLDPVLQVGMHHAALDGAGPHDRHLDDEVVVGARLQPRQHRHLRPALDLEHADRIGLAQHVEHGGIDRIHADGALLAVVLLDQVEALAQAGQHAEPQHVDLVDPESVEVVLVPFDDGAVLHGGILDRHQLVEPPVGQHEAADMLREMTRKAAQRSRQFERQHQAGIGGIEAGLAHMADIDAARAHAPHGVGHGAHRVGRQAERLADLADGAAAPVGDHRGGKRGAMAAFLLVDPLDDLFAPLVLEVDVDVGRLVALVGQEALEQDL